MGTTYAGRLDGARGFREAVPPARRFLPPRSSLAPALRRTAPGRRRSSVLPPTYPGSMTEQTAPSRPVPGPLREHLDHEALPVHGAHLEPEDFIPVPGGWEARQEIDGRSRTVRLLLDDGGLVRCEIDGEPVPYPDPYWKHSLADVAPAQGWFDHFAGRDAEGRRQATAWEGESVEAMLRRAEHNVVAYDEQEISGSALRTLGDLQAWLDEHLAPTNMRASARLLRGFPSRIDDKLAPGRLLVAMEEGEIVSYCAAVVGTDIFPYAWFDFMPGASVMEPRIEMLSEGPAMISNAGDWLLEEAPLREAGALVDVVAEASLREEWAVILVQGLPYAIPFPADGANLRIRLDGDASRVEIVVSSSAVRAEHLRARDLYERRWGRFLDDSVVLSDEELRAGIERAEQEARAALAADAVSRAEAGEGRGTAAGGSAETNQEGADHGADADA